MSPLDAADRLAGLAGQMIDWLQGYDVPNPLEDLGGAIVEYRESRGGIGGEDSREDRDVRAGL